MLPQKCSPPPSQTAKIVIPRQRAVFEKFVPPADKSLYIKAEQELSILSCF